MIFLGLLLIVLGLFGVARWFLLPIGTFFIGLGVVLAILHFVFHTVALLF